MQFKIFAAAAAVMSSAVQAQSTITATKTPNAAQLSKIISDLNSVVTGTAFASAVNGYVSYVVSASAAGQTVEPGFPTTIADPSNWPQYVSAVNLIATQSYASSIPTDVVNAQKSGVQQIVSLINKDISAAPGTMADRSVVVTGVIMAGAVVIALVI